MLCMCTRHVGSDAVLGSVDVPGWVDGEHLLFFILYFMAFSLLGQSTFIIDHALGFALGVGLKLQTVYAL